MLVQGFASGGFGDIDILEQLKAFRGVTFFLKTDNQAARLESPARALKVMTVTRSDPTYYF